VAGVQVNFGTTPAPLLFVSSREIDCVAAFEVAENATTAVQVQYNGVQSNPVLMPVTGLAAQLLEVLNEDFTINTPSNPAQPGSIMSVYVAGMGQTVPPSLDGQVNQPPFAKAGTEIQVQYIPSSTEFFQNLPVTYAGAAPGEIAGILQVNFMAPPQSSTVRLLAGNSRSEFTVSIQ
jgi:uncharacterized protein (TIGR03437 family)